MHHCWMWYNDKMKFDSWYTIWELLTTYIAYQRVSYRTYIFWYKFHWLYIRCCNLEKIRIYKKYTMPILNNIERALIGAWYNNNL